MHGGDNGVTFLGTIGVPLILILACVAPGWVPGNKMDKSRQQWQRAVLSTPSQGMRRKHRKVWSVRWGESRESQVRDHWREWLWYRQW